MKPCFGYIRVSTLRQGEGVSLQEQKDAILACAAIRNLQIIEWFEELETAAKSGRPIFNRMIARLRKGHAQGFVVHKIDRSARNLKDWALVSELPDQGIDVHIATESLDFNTRGGRMTADFLAVIAADFIRNQREETKKGLNGRLKQGLYPFKAPLGYLDMGRGVPKAPCPIKAPLIKELYQLYLSGQHSLRSLHVEMQKQGLKGHTERPVSLHGIEKILGNTFYHGLITIVRTGETFDGVHKPLISKAAFRQVQKIKARRCGPKVTRHNHRFMGLFRCGLCAGPMVPELQKAVYVYYRCKAQKCRMKTIREDRLEAAILKRLADVQLNKTTVAQQMKRWKSGRVQEELMRKRGSLVARIEAEDTRLARAADLLIEGTLDRQTYNNKKRDAEFALGRLREDLDGLPDPKAMNAARDAYICKMSQLSALYKAATMFERRQLIENTFGTRFIKPEGVELELHAWTECKTCVPKISREPPMNPILW